MGFDDDSALGDGLEEVRTRGAGVIVEITEPECLEEESIDADLGGSLELQFVLQLRLESRLSQHYTLGWQGPTFFKYYLILII